MLMLLLPQFYCLQGGTARRPRLKAEAVNPKASPLNSNIDLLGLVGHEGIYYRDKD